MKTITNTLLVWYSEHGRKDLPWQNTNDAYRIWLSEIMLQQTQVKTVIPYYEKFIQQFPTINALANASIDQVLHLWTGLGYYARARNLHKTACIINEQFNGKFPNTFDQALELPGIGRSTAGAILAFSQNQRYPILDGNVKRVLARYYAVEGWSGQKSIETKLWDLADQNTPDNDVDLYTQAIMDFGATLCTRTKPKCTACPLNISCQTFKSDRVGEFPYSKPKTAKPNKETFMLLIQNDKSEFLLEQRPPTGIWGGLWCPPQVEKLENKMEIAHYNIKVGDSLEAIKHTFSHYHLLIKPVTAQIISKRQMVADQSKQIWYKTSSQQQLGLAAPVKELLNKYS